MATDSKKPKGRDWALLALTAAIEFTTFGKEASPIAPAKAVFGPVSIILTTIKEFMINEKDYVSLGLYFNDICQALNRGTNGKRSEDLNESAREAIKQLTITFEEIKMEVTKQSKRNGASRFISTKADKEQISAWRSKLDRILHVFNAELTINTNTTVSDLGHDLANTLNIVSDTHDVVAVTQNVVSDTYTIVSNTQNIIQSAMLRVQGGSGNPDLSTQKSPRGEPLPQPLKTCFGRNDLIEQVVGLVEDLKPVALIGAGGIGKTSIALAVLHDDRIKKRFGDYRRFIRCDQFPASLPQFLNKLSKAVGAGIENPENLDSLHPFLSSAEMIIFLDNAESILDPEGPDARGIYKVVEELSRFGNICVGITSRMSTVPPRFKRPAISTLSMESACDIFYDIYDDGGRSDVVKALVKELDFHALSITLLATTASHNVWDYDRLARRWKAHRTQVLRTDYNESLAAAIELSLSSPSFRNLGPHARDLLGVTAFFPQGIDENNLDWLFPTIPNRTTIFEKFCVLSLTSRSGEFVTMLAPIRDHLCPRDPALSTLLCATRDHYFTRLSVKIEPDMHGFEETRWIVSEDVNIERLLDVFTSIDMNSDVVWKVCGEFMNHLYWHKVRHTVLGPKIEGLPDDHHFKPNCLKALSQLFSGVGNFVEQKRLLTYALKLEVEKGKDFEVARLLMGLSEANEELRLCEEGIEQARAALVIFERVGEVVMQAGCWGRLAVLFQIEKRLEEAEDAALHGLGLLPEAGQEYLVCKLHRTLGNIYLCRREGEEVIHHLGEALGFASTFGWNYDLCLINISLAVLFALEKKFDDANTHVEQAKSYTSGNEYNLGVATFFQAKIWYFQGVRLEEANSEALSALEVFEKLGASEGAKECKDLLRRIADVKGSSG